MQGNNGRGYNLVFLSLLLQFFFTGSPYTKIFLYQLNGVYVLHYGHRFGGFSSHRGFQNGDESHTTPDPECFHGPCDQFGKQLLILREIWVFKFPGIKLVLKESSVGKGEQK